MRLGRLRRLRNDFLWGLTNTMCPDYEVAGRFGPVESRMVMYLLGDGPQVERGCGQRAILRVSH